MNYVLYVHDPENVFNMKAAEVQRELGELIADYTMQKVTIDIVPMDEEVRRLQEEVTSLEDELGNLEAEQFDNREGQPEFNGAYGNI
ncbi:MAG: hypothetical protein ABIQ65_15770 [Thermoanaerobaculia bacterium]